MRLSTALVLSLLLALGRPGYGQQATPVPTPAPAAKHKVKHKKPASPPAVKKFPRIDLRQVNTDSGYRMGYFYADKELRSYGDLQAVIDPLGDARASRLLRSSSDKASVGTGVMIGGVALTVGSLAYVIATESGTGNYSQGTSTPAVSPWGFVAVGTGLVSTFIGMHTLDAATDDKRGAVDRYNQVAAPPGSETPAFAGNAPSHTNGPTTQAPKTPPAPKHIKVKPAPPVLVPRFPPIEFKRVCSGSYCRNGYFWKDLELRTNDNFEEAIDPLGDARASHLLRSSEHEKDMGDTELVSGLLLTAGGLFFTLTNGPTTQIQGEEYPGIPIYSVTAPNNSLSVIAIGAGVVAIVAGTATLDAAGNDKRGAVELYDHLAAQSPPSPEVAAGANPPASTPVTPAAAQNPPTGQEAAAPVSAAAAPVSAPPIPHGFGFGLSPLVDFPLSGNTANQFLPGLGVDLGLEVPLDDNFSLAFETDFQDFPMNQANFDQTFQQTYGQPLPYGVSISGGWTSPDFLAQIKVSFPEAKFRFAPYFFWGGGLAINNQAFNIGYEGQTISASISETDFLLTQGLGLAFRPAPDLEIFAQGRLDILFTSQNNSDSFTITSSSGSASGKSNLSGDSPTVFLPVQVGFRIWQ